MYQPHGRSLYDTSFFRRLDPQALARTGQIIRIVRGNTKYYENGKITVLIADGYQIQGCVILSEYSQGYFVITSSAMSINAQSIVLRLQLTDVGTIPWLVVLLRDTTLDEEFVVSFPITAYPVKPNTQFMYAVHPLYDDQCKCQLLTQAGASDVKVQFDLANKRCYITSSEDAELLYKASFDELDVLHTNLHKISDDKNVEKFLKMPLLDRSKMYDAVLSVVLGYVTGSNGSTMVGGQEVLRQQTLVLQVRRQYILLVFEDCLHRDAIYTFFRLICGRMKAFDRPETGYLDVVSGLYCGKETAQDGKVAFSGSDWRQPLVCVYSIPQYNVCYELRHDGADKRIPQGATCAIHCLIMRAPYSRPLEKTPEYVGSQYTNIACTVISNYGERARGSICLRGTMLEIVYQKPVLYYKYNNARQHKKLQLQHKHTIPTTEKNGYRAIFSASGLNLIIGQGEMRTSLDIEIPSAQQLEFLWHILV